MKSKIVKFLAFLLLILLFFDVNITAIVYGGMLVSMIALVLMILGAGLLVAYITKHWIDE